MSEEAQNILSKQIKGLTWGVVLTIITVFGGGAVAGITAYINVVKQLTTLIVVVEQTNKIQEDNHKQDIKRSDDMNYRICTIESRLIPQAK